MNRKLGSILIDKLYNSGNLSLKECGDNRDKLNKLKENQIEIFLTSLPNAELFLPEIINQIKEAEEVKLTKDNSRAPQPIFGFFESIFISILTPLGLFVLFFLFAGKWDNSIDLFADGRAAHFSYNSSPFHFKHTWWIWAIYVFFIVLIEIRLFKRRVYSKYFDNSIRITLYHLSTILTVVAIIIFSLSIMVQYGDGVGYFDNLNLASRIGKSTRDGFIFYVFFIPFLAPTISWLIYYLVIKKGDALTKVIKDSRKMKNEHKQVVKRSEVVKQIKEAKELLDLGILTQAEYDELIKKLKPIILNN